MLSLIYLLSWLFFESLMCLLALVIQTIKNFFNCLWWLRWDFQFFRTWILMNLNYKRGKREGLKWCYFFCLFCRLMVALFEFFCNWQANMLSLSFMRSISNLKLVQIYQQIIDLAGFLAISIILIWLHSRVWSTWFTQLKPCLPFEKVHFFS